MAKKINMTGITKMNPGRKAQTGNEIWPVDGDVQDISVPVDFGDYPSGLPKVELCPPPYDVPFTNRVNPKKGDDTPGGGW